MANNSERAEYAEVREDLLGKLFCWMESVDDPVLREKHGLVFLVTARYGPLVLR